MSQDLNKGSIPYIIIIILLYCYYYYYYLATNCYDCYVRAHSNVTSQSPGFLL